MLQSHPEVSPPKPLASRESCLPDRLASHATHEVVWLESSDAGRTFTAQLIMEPDPQCARWMPSVERPTGHNRAERPSLIFTAGLRGAGTADILSNRVYYLTP